eukprot:9478982-Pyramimonas_sp.AAC.1
MRCASFCVSLHLALPRLSSIPLSLLAALLGACRDDGGGGESDGGGSYFSMLGGRVVAAPRPSARPQN